MTARADIFAHADPSGPYAAIDMRHPLARMSWDAAFLGARTARRARPARHEKRPREAGVVGEVEDAQATRRMMTPVLLAPWLSRTVTVVPKRPFVDGLDQVSMPELDSETPAGAPEMV